MSSRFWNFTISFPVGFTNGRICAMMNVIIEQWEVRGCPPAAGWGRGENRERGANPRQDRCCDAERRAICHWNRSEKAVRRDEAQSEDLPANRVSNLRPKERYVPVARTAVGGSHGRAALAMLYRSRDISVLAGISCFFMLFPGKRSFSR